MSFVQFLLQQALFIFPNTMNRLRLLMDAGCVLYEVATKYLYRQLFDLFRLPPLFFLSIIPTVRLRSQRSPSVTTFQQHSFPRYQSIYRGGYITGSFLVRHYAVSESGRLSTGCFRQLLASSCLSVCLSAWNPSAPIARLFIKFCI